MAAIKRKRPIPRGTQATYAGKPSSTAQIEGWLLKGRRCDADLAQRKWGIDRVRYNASIRLLAKRHPIDTDVKVIKRLCADGVTRRVMVGTHTIVR